MSVSIKGLGIVSISGEPGREMDDAALCEVMVMVVLVVVVVEVPVVESSRMVG